MSSFSQRSYEKELIDRDDIPFPDIQRNMRELDIINTWLGGHAISIRGLKNLLGRIVPAESYSPGVPARPIVICEIGCGGGDNLRAMMEYCRRRNIPVRVIGVDRNEYCIEVARSRVGTSDADWIVADYATVGFEGSKPDIIFSSLFCHHFTDEELVYMLKWMQKNARVGWFINDLHRHPLAFHSIRLLSGWFSRSYLVKNDAPLSVRRGFSERDWHRLLGTAGIRLFSIRWQWAFRWLVLSGKDNGGKGGDPGFARRMEGDIMLQGPATAAEAPEAEAEAPGEAAEPAYSTSSRIAGQYDVAIIGGGLAGLALSIQLAKGGYSVALFEKESYPFHKVCGEYVSLESWNFLEELGLPLSDWNLPIIRHLLLSAPNGATIRQELPLGGFGISRYKLDAALAEIARASGVTLYESVKVNDIRFERSRFLVGTTIGTVQAKVACGTYGKRSNLDIRWKRPFVLQRPGTLNNYIGVKYHVQIPPEKARDFLPDDQISLHNFAGGYCGISRIEDNRYCLCYLTTAENLRKSEGSISRMEQDILCQNPYLDRILGMAIRIYGQPLTISRISFARKSQVTSHVLLVGDAAGMVTPLSGNGMSMALHGSKIAFISIDAFLTGQIARHEMEQEFTDQWNRQFGRRLWIGRMLQRWFGNRKRTDLLIRILKPFPKLVSFLIRQTHGQPF